MKFFGKLQTEQTKTNVPWIVAMNKGFTSVPYESLMEKFKTEIRDTKTFLRMMSGVDKNIKDHPFSYKILLDAYMNIGLVTCVVNKYVDYVLGPGFYVKSKNTKAETLLNQHFKEMFLFGHVKEWMKYGYLLGCSGMEISTDDKGSPNGYKQIDPETFFLKYEKGNYAGASQVLTVEGKTEEIPLDRKNVAVLNVNKIKYYGIGLIYPAMKYIDDICKSSLDLHTLQNRKANAPIWWRMGGIVNGQLLEPSAADVASWGKEQDYLNNKTEFSTSYLCEPKVIDFGQIGEKFSFVIDFDWKQYYTSVQVPQVLLGEGNVAEGLANKQSEAFDKVVFSLQEEAEQVLIEQICKPFLKAQGLVAEIDIIWGLPSQDEKNKKLAFYSDMLKNPMLSEGLRGSIEVEVAKMLDLQVEEAPAQERKKEEDKIKQPEVPGEKSECLHEHARCTCEEGVDWEEEEKKDYSLKEWLNFNFGDYKKWILKVIAKDNFENLAAKNAEEVAAGKFTARQVKNMRGIMDTAIRDDWTIRQISNSIKTVVKPKDRYKIGDEGKLELDKEGELKLQLSAKYRSLMIARTETSRLSNTGLLEHYKDSNVEKVSWMSSPSERTCDFCLGQYGKIMTLGEAQGQIPAHNLCRCTWRSVQEVPK